MLSLIAIASLVVVVCGKSDEYREIAEIAERVNAAQTTWTATNDYEMTLRVRKLFRQYGSCTHKPLKNVKVKKYDKKELADLPKSFDAREKWPNCKYIGHLRSQGICGSCWAMGSTEAMTDRICIHSNGKDQAYLSSEHVVSCAVINGCSGGEIENVYDFYKKKGIVTGGDYDSSEGCWPYPFEPTEPKLFHTNRNRHRLPNDEDPPTPECVNECPNKGYKIKFEDDKHKGQEYHTFKTVEDIQKEILENGPVAASFTVYDDFSLYESGIYQHPGNETSDEGHVVKIIGWGVENNVDYWLMANSWGPKWGEKGYFRMLRGKNNCDIEAGVIAGLPIPK